MFAESGNIYFYQIRRHLFPTSHIEKMVTFYNISLSVNKNLFTLQYSIYVQYGVKEFYENKISFVSMFLWTYSRSEIFNFLKVESGCTTLVLADKRQKRNNEFAFWPLYTVQYSMFVKKKL